MTALTVGVPEVDVTALLVSVLVTEVERSDDRVAPDSMPNCESSLSHIL